MTEMGRSARAAARVLASSSVEQRNEALLQIRAAIAADRDAILAANEMDLGQARESGLEAALLDRLALSPAQLDVLEEGLSQVAALPDLSALCRICVRCRRASMLAPCECPWASSA